MNLSTFMSYVGLVHLKGTYKKWDLGNRMNKFEQDKQKENIN